MANKESILFKSTKSLISSTKWLVDYKYLSLTFILMLLSFGDCMAQIPPPPDPGAIPIDGGIGFLIAAGVVYGAKKSMEFKKKKED